MGQLGSSRWVWAILLGMLALSIAACSGNRGGYPELQAPTALHKPGVCHNCGRNIEQVEEKNMLDMKSAQYVVCGEKCAAQQRKWHEAQYGKPSSGN